MRIFLIYVSLITLGLQGCLDPKKYESSDVEMDLGTSPMMDMRTPVSGGQNGGTSSDVGGQNGGMNGGSMGGNVGGMSGGDMGGDLGGNAGGQNGGTQGGQVGGELGGMDGGSTGGSMGGQMLPPTECEVTFNVSLPLSTPMSDSIYVAGDFLPSEDWTPDAEDGLMVRDNSTATLTLVLPQLQNIAYKFTRGSWDSVEASGSCSQVENRFTLVRCTAQDPQLVIDSTVENWSGIGGDCP